MSNRYLVECDNILVINNLKVNQPLSISTLGSCSTCKHYKSGKCVKDRWFAAKMGPNDFCSKWDVDVEGA